MTFTRFDRLFFLERNFSHFWGAQAAIWEGHSLEIPARGTGPVTLFWSTILAWGHIFRLGGTMNDLGARLGNVPPPPVAQCLHSRLRHYSQNYKHSRPGKEVNPIMEVEING